MELTVKVATSDRCEHRLVIQKARAHRLVRTATPQPRRPTWPGRRRGPAAAHRRSLFCPAMQNPPRSMPMAYQSYPLGQQLPQGPLFHSPPSPPDMGPKPTRTRVSNERNTPPYPQSHPPQMLQADGRHDPSFYPHPYMANPQGGGVSPNTAGSLPRADGNGPALDHAPQSQSACFLIPGPPPSSGSQGQMAHPGAPPLPVIYTQVPYMVPSAAPGTPPSSASPSTGGSLPSAPPRSPSEPAMSPGGIGSNHYAPSTSVPRLPPILQVEKQQVTTTATQAASASRRRNEAHFVCPVPGCGSTFTRRFNLRGRCLCELICVCVLTTAYRPSKVPY